MEFIEVRNSPEFTMEVERWTRETDADGAAMAVVTGQLFNNTWFNKQENERQDSTALVTLAAGGWTGSAPPYVQSVAVAGASAEGPDALLVSALEDGASLEAQKAYMKAFGIVSSGTATLGDSVAVFKVYKRPEVDITVGLRGVMP